MHASCKHEQFQVSCSVCAPLFSNLGLATHWMKQEASKRGINGTWCHYNASITPRNQLIFLMGVNDLNHRLRLIGYARTPFANHTLNRNEFNVCRL
jgi:hypothetical protein